MNTKMIVAMVGIIVGIGYIEFVLNAPKTVNKPTGNAVEVKWEQLYTLNYETGEVPEDLKAYDGKRVKIAGFVVPLTDNFTILEEFLLVPDAQSCVHVPPPPPNLIVQSKLEVPLTSDKVYNPAWITGILKIEKTESKYGAAGFQMVVEKLEEYVY